MLACELAAAELSVLVATTSAIVLVAAASESGVVVERGISTDGEDVAST